MGDTSRRSNRTARGAAAPPAAEASAVVWQLDAVGALTGSGETWARFTGQPASEASGTGWLHMIHPDDRRGVERRSRAAARSGAPQQCRAQVWSARHGGFVPLTLHWAPATRADGSVRECVVLGEQPAPVTRTDGAGDGASTGDGASAGNGASADHGAVNDDLGRRAARQKALADLSYAALRGDDVTTLLREAVAMLVAHLEVALAVASRHTAEGRETAATQVREEGEPPLTEDEARSGVSVPIRTADGTVWGGLAIYTARPRAFLEHEISILQSVANVMGTAVSRAQTEEELRITEARLHVALGAASITVMHVDRDLRCEWAMNLPRGVDGDLLLGRRFDAFLPREEADDVASLHQAVLEREAPVHRQVSLTTNGVVRTYDMFAEPFRDPRGEVVGVTTAAVDVTRHSRFESELEAARRTAEEANASKDHFLAVVSHELRNPLTAVLAAAEELSADDGLPPPTRRALELIERNARHEKRLIDDLLDVSRLARGLVDLDCDRVDVCEVLREAVETSVREATENGVTLANELDRHGCWVVGDAQRLRQVALNLLRNAISHAEDGTVRVRCRGEGESVIWSVEDDGEGIEPSLLPTIFDAFQRGEQAGRSALGGLGLGLNVCRSLVEQHGGSIEARSDGHGRGARFVVRLPRAADQRPSRPPESHVRRPDGPLDVLLVEDHEDTAEVMSIALGRRGHSVRAVGSAADALSEIDNGGADPDVVVSDLGLPDRSGLELIREIRARRPELPAVAVSGFGAQRDVAKAHEAGFDAHVTKPVSSRQLLSTIADVLSRRRERGRG